MKKNGLKLTNPKQSQSEKDGVITQKREKTVFTKALRKTKQRKNPVKLAGFDIETCDNNKTFVCASLVRDDRKPFFTRNKDVIINELKSWHWRGYTIFVTNLGFDFLGLFFDKKELQNFKIIMRGSDFIMAKTYVIKGKFSLDSSGYGGYSQPLIFGDTMNYAKMSLEKIGKIIKVPKMKKPSCLGKMPSSIDEWDELREYNINDSTVTLRYAQFLQRNFRLLGGELKITGASSSLKIYKNKYLKDTYFIHDKEILRDIFKAYHGGRSEVFVRGIGKSKLFYHDINSMYPYCMQSNSFPNPNFLRISEHGTISHIQDYDGVSFVRIIVPEMDFPPLPYKKDDKTMFMTGILEGFYAHNELRYALGLRCKIEYIGKSYYYLENCRPFTEFVDDLYKKRLQFKLENNPAEHVVKILLNSFYGKFAQKFDGKEEVKNIVNCSTNDFEMSEIITHDVMGQWVIVKKDKEPTSFNQVIWSVYVTAYARIMIHKIISQHKAYYCDTDSIICDHLIENSKLLGGLKLEHTIKEFCFVSPKFYSFINDDEEHYVKCKGSYLKDMNFYDFVAKVKSGKFSIMQTRFTKFRTALRKNLIPNETFEFEKVSSLTENKRKWSKKFNGSLQFSKPQKYYINSSKLQQSI